MASASDASSSSFLDSLPFLSLEELRSRLGERKDDRILKFLDERCRQEDGGDKEVRY